MGLAFSWSQWVKDSLELIKNQNLYRKNTPIELFGPRGTLEKNTVVSFASNDYLGISSEQEVIQASIDAILKYGTSSQASRLIAGTRKLHDELENMLAEYKQTEAALVFPTGYQTNVGILTVFGSQDAVILSDELNHASIIDGARLAKAEVIIYRHCDLNDLNSKLIMASKRNKRLLIVTDLIFSMDGDIAPISDIASIADKFSAMLVVDEAHAPLGPQLVLDSDKKYFGCDILRVGTLSKIFGSLGGFVCGKKEFIELLINKARSYIFTTALSPADTAAALAGLKILSSEQGKRLKKSLADNIDLLLRIFDRKASPVSPVFPLIVGSEEKAIDISKKLMAESIFVPAIRPPTVPRGTSRLRISLSAKHTKDEILRLAEVIKSCDV